MTVRLVPKTPDKKLETPCVQQPLNELIMVYSDNGILQSSEKEQTTAEYSNMNKSIWISFSVYKASHRIQSMISIKCMSKTCKTRHFC